MIIPAARLGDNADMRRMLSLFSMTLLMGCAAKDRLPEQTPKSGPATEVTFKAADGVSITADWRAVKGEMAVILLPMRGHDATSWAPFVSAFAKEGISTLALDPRGVGRSERQGGQTIEAAWDLTLDIEGAVKFLGAAGKKKIGIAGASYGANNALIYAAARPAVKAVALLSPGEDYHGLRIAEAASAYKGAVCVVSATGDRMTGTGPDTIRKATGDRAIMVWYEGSEHGTDILRKYPAALDKLAHFLSTRL